MKDFWKAFRESTITQGLITLVLTVTICYLAACEKPIPTLIAYGFTSALSFFFGAKIQQALGR